MGLSTQGLHHHAWLCPGSCTPFLTFLDHGLVQEAHSRVIYCLQIEEVGREGRYGLSCQVVPSPRLLRPTRTTGCLRRLRGYRRDQESPGLGTICVQAAGLPR